MNSKKTKTDEMVLEGGEKLKQARLKKGLTQEQCAAKLGVSTSHYCHLEQGVKSVYRMNGALRLAIKKLLKVSF